MPIQLRKRKSIEALLNNDGEGKKFGMSLLKANDEVLDKLVDSLPFKVHIVDRDMNVVVWNKKGEEGPYGVKRTEAVGRPLQVVYSANRDRTAVPKKIDNVISECMEVFEKGSVFSMEDISVLRSGEKRYYKVTKAPLRLESGAVSHVVTIIEDLTDKKQKEAGLIARERFFPMEELAAGIAHQINNPLSTMTICVESLLNEVKKGIIRDPQMGHKFEKYLDMTYKEIIRCKNISNILANMSKSSSDESVSIDLNSVIAEMLDIMTISRKKSGYAVETDFADGLPPIRAKEHLLRQAIASIILNAFEATAEKKAGLLRVSTSAFTSNGVDMVSARISDNGCGIEKSQMGKIFTPFYTTKGGNRIGLGLYVANGIITEIGGRIEVESRAGEGATFTVVLPARRRELKK